MAGIDSYTKLMLHMNSDFTDSSADNHTPTVNGATIDTGIKELGAGSGKFVSASSQDVRYPDHPSFYLGSGDFALDFWARWTSLTVSELVGLGLPAGGIPRSQFRYNSSSNIWQILSYTSSNDLVFDASSDSWTPTLLQWYHIEFDRAGNNFYFFINGVQLGSTVDVTGESFTDATTGLSVGSWNGAEYFDGHLDELRLSKGIARHTSDFTPRSTEYTVDVLKTLSLNQRYSLTGATLITSGLNQRYSLTGATLITSALNQRYGLDAPTGPNLLSINQRYALAGAALKTSSINQRYALSSVVLNETSLNQRYALSSVVLNETSLNQLWALFTPTGPHLTSLNQRYILNGFHIPATEYHAITYSLTLTGAPDSLADIVLPMSSFQTRLKDGDPSWLSVIVPNGRVYADSINARPNGELVVMRIGVTEDGTPESVERARVDLETIRTDEGPFKSSATLAGHKTTSAGTPKGVALELATLRSVYSGKVHIESKMDSNIVPGDQAEHNSQVFTVGEIFIAVNPTFTLMRVTEA